MRSMIPRGRSNVERRPRQAREFGEAAGISQIPAILIHFLERRESVYRRTDPLVVPIRLYEADCRSDTRRHAVIERDKTSAIQKQVRVKEIEEDIVKQVQSVDEDQVKRL